MLKLVVVLALFITIQAQLLGGFTDRPDLLDSALTRSMVKLAVTELANGQNIRASPMNIVSVSSQVVNGVNYRVVFTARSVTTNAGLTCTAKVFQQFSGAQSLSSVTCA